MTRSFATVSDLSAMPLKRTRTVQLALLALACTFPNLHAQTLPATPAAPAPLAPQAERITDGRILGDRQTLEAVQQRLRVLNEKGVAQNHYPLAKAQCWLDSAKTQYHENDRTGYVDEALAESVKIVQALEADPGARAGLDTPLVAGSTRLREDLWSRLAAFKGDAATQACTARTVACAEVRLVRAGHAEQQTGWRQATPHVAMAEDAVARAAREAATCPPPPAVTTAAAAALVSPGATAVAASPVVVVHKESIVLQGDALFRFDRSGRDDLLPGGQERLREVAENLKKQYRSIESIAYVGHTDRWGSDAHNDALSRQRANTVRAYLESLGVKAGTVSAEGRGRREPLVECSTRPPKAEQVVCLQPNRRVAIEVLGVK